MSIEKNVPEIRFKGFSGEWVEKELKSFCDSFSYGLNASAINFDGVNKYLRITDIDDKSRRFDYGALTSPDVDISKSDEYLLKSGDLLFARTGASVGKTYLYNALDGKVFFAGFLIRATVNEKTSPQFIFQNTLTTAYEKFVVTTSQRSGQPGINAKEYAEYRLFSPDTLEQTAIGNYFQKLDSLINQHQQKQDKLSSIKKAMLEKMFPKPGETIPEIRFKGFSGEWEEKEFSSIANRVSTQHQSRYLPCVEYEDIVAGEGRLNKDIFQKNIFKAGLKFEVNDVLFGKLRPYLRNWLLADFNGIAVGDFWVLRAETVAKTFLFYLIQTKRFELISNLSAGSKMPRSDWGLVSKSSFYVPIEISESEMIGNYFQKLDALINQHQQQINKLNNIKQACLSKMFV